MIPIIKCSLNGTEFECGNQIIARTIGPDLLGVPEITSKKSFASTIMSSVLNRGLIKILEVGVPHKSCFCLTFTVIDFRIHTSCGLIHGPPDFTKL